MQSCPNVYKLVFTVFRFFTVVPLLLLVVFTPVRALAATNQTINFQGKLVDSSGLNVTDGTAYQLTFKLYNGASGGTAIWTEVQSNVTVTSGIFQVQLGSVTPLTGVDFNNSNLYLGITVSGNATGGATGELEMTPRIQFTAVPYAFNAASLQGVVATQSASGFTLTGGYQNSKTLNLTDNITLGLTITPSSTNSLTVKSNGASGLTLDTGGAAALGIGASANAITIGNNTFANNTAVTITTGGSGVVTIGSNTGTGNVVVAPNAGGQAALVVNDQGTGDIFTASASGTTIFNVMRSGLATLSGALTLAGGASNPSTFLTPVGASVTTKLNVPLYDPGAYNQIVAMGLPSTANANARVMSLFDARTGSHQPTLAIFAPDEQHVAGLSWEGSSSDVSLINTQGTGSDYVSFGGTNAVGFSTGAGLTLFKGSKYAGGHTVPTNLYIGAGGSTPNAASMTWGDGTGWQLNMGYSSNTNTFVPTFTFEDLGRFGIGTTSLLSTIDIRGDRYTTPVASMSGATGKATLVLDQSGVGDIFSASQSGGTRFTISANGNLTDSNYAVAGGILYGSSTGLLQITGAGTGSQCLVGGATPSWGSCGTGGSSAFKELLASGVIVPLNATEDFLVGGTSTASAHFAVLGVNDNATVASVSAQNVNNSAVYVDAGNNALQTVKNQPLTIGGNTTGNILLSPLNNTAGGFVGIGTTTPSDRLDVASSNSVVGILNEATDNGFTAIRSKNTAYAGYDYGIAGAAAAVPNAFYIYDAAQSQYRWSINPTTGNMSVGGIFTANAPISFGTGVQTNKLYLYDGTNDKYGFGVATNTLQIYSGAGAGSSATIQFGKYDGTTLTEFMRLQNGNLGIGTGANPTAMLDVAGAASISGSLTFRSGSSAIQATALNNLLLGGNTTGSILLGTNNGTGNVFVQPNAGGQAALIVSDQGTGDLFTASAGASTKFTISNSGNISATGAITGLTGITLASGGINLGGTVGSGTQCLLGGATASWGSCSGTPSTPSPFKELLASGVIVPLNATEDFLVGGTSTASADFGLINVAGGTPTATISAGVAGALTLDAAGNIQTTALQNLSIGGGSTGGVSITAGTAVASNGTGFALGLSAGNGLGSSGKGGSITVTAGGGGGGTGSGLGGSITITAGSGSGSGGGTGGNLIMDAGSGTGSNGSITIGGTNASALTFGGAQNPTFTFAGTGALTFNNLKNCALITTNSSGVASCGSAVGGSSPFKEVTASGVIVPLNTTEDFLIGGTATTSADFGILNIASNTLAAPITASISGSLGALYMNANGSISTTRRENITIGNGLVTGGIRINSGSDTSTSGTGLDITIAAGNGGALSGIGGNVTINAGSAATKGTITIGSTINGGVTIGNTQPGVSGSNVNITTGGFGVINLGSNTGVGNIVVAPNAGGQAGLMINDQGIGDIFTASASGAPKFTITNAGGIRINSGIASTTSEGSSGQCLQSGGVGAGLAWGSCGGTSTGSSPFKEVTGTNGGLIVPLNATEDFLIGGTATTSADFAFMNVSSLTNAPTASISAGSGSNATYLTGSGTLATTNRQNLVLGSSTSTGAITIQAGNSVGGGLGVTITGGSMTASSGTAGGLTFKSGSGGNGGGVAGNVTIDTGGAGGGISGSINIGTSNANNIYIGGTATPITFGGGGNTVTFNPSSGLVYAGTARLQKTITLSPEYAGAVLTASGSATTTGSMTSDASSSASLSTDGTVWKTFYSWSSTTASPLQDYTVAVRVTLPQDFSAWQSTAMTIDYDTLSTSSTNNALDVYIYNPSATNPTAPVYFSTNNVSANWDGWTTLSIGSAPFGDGVNPDWNTAGQSAVVYLKMHAMNGSHVLIGDIKLNYLSKF